MYNSASTSSQFYHMPTTQVNQVNTGVPLLQVMHQPAFINHPLNYSQPYTVNSPTPVITRHVSPIRSLPPIAINQPFIPKSLGDHSGHIISIPAPLKGARFHLTSNKKFPSHYISHNKANYQHQKI